MAVDAPSPPFPPLRPGHTPSEGLWGDVELPRILWLCGFLGTVAAANGFSRRAGTQSSSGQKPELDRLYGQHLEVLSSLSSLRRRPSVVLSRGLSPRLEAGSGTTVTADLC